MKKYCSGALIMLSMAGLLLSGCRRTEKPDELQIVEKEPDKVIINFLTSIESAKTASSTLWKEK